jgi:hypothetical protein
MQGHGSDLHQKGVPCVSLMGSERRKARYAIEHQRRDYTWKR